MASARKHEDLVTAQFGPQAAAYVASIVHAQGEDLQQLAAFVRGAKEAKALDLGCGGGHVSFHVAPEVATVIAYDLSADMLAAVAAEATRRGLDNITGRQGAAEQTPFADNSFDFVFSRFSAHHWRDVPRALREAFRVAAQGAKVAFVDAIAPASVALDTFIQTIEVLRDPSHVRDYTESEWRHMATEAGFKVEGVALRRLPLDFASWIARMNTPDLHAQAIRSLETKAPEETRAHFDIRPDGSFTLDTMTLELRKP